MLDSLNNYNVICKIGEGSFSEVLKVKDKKTRQFYAAKRLTKNYSSLDEAVNCDELKTLRKLEYHPNVLSLVDFVYEGNGTLTLLFDLMDMSIYDYIKNRKKTLSEKRCKNYLFQMVQGLSYLHRSGIFHRDLKPENILIRTDQQMKNTNPSMSQLIQLADLGSACQIDFPLPHSAYISTRWYRAPECLLTSGFYGPKMDIWALGCCFYEIFTLHPLFPGNSEIDQLDQIHQIIGTPPASILNRFKHLDVEYDFPKKKSVGFHNLVPSLSSDGVDVLKKTLNYHPENRISAAKLLEHRYFEDFQGKFKNSAVRRWMMSTSIEPSSKESSKKDSKTSTSSSQGSLSSSRSTTLKKLKETQDKLNKQLERGWGMNTSPVKDKIMKNIKSSVQHSQKTFR